MLTLMVIGGIGTCVLSEIHSAGPSLCTLKGRVMSSLPCRSQMPRYEKSPEEVARAEEQQAASHFLRRVQQAKRDPAFAGYADMISGLFENDQWFFACSEHLNGRFSNEDELKKHFAENSHTRHK